MHCSANMKKLLSDMVVFTDPFIMPIVTTPFLYKLLRQWRPPHLYRRKHVPVLNLAVIIIAKDGELYTTIVNLLMMKKEIIT